ncbi:MAG: cytochrome P450 [Solirubrobacteraceae bacterium]
MTETSVLPPRFDALDAAVLDDPYPAYARLRAAGPLARGGAGTWVATRHADVAALLRDPRLSSGFPVEYHRMSAGDGAAATFMSSIILYRDPPAHTRLRRLIGQAFGAGAVRGLTPRVDALVDELLDPALQRGELDAIGELALPLPVMVVCELMGLPVVDHEAIRPHALALGRAFAAVVPESAREQSDRAVTWLREYLGAALAQRRRRPGDDLLSALLAAEAGEERLSHEEIVDNAVFAFFAGFETTTNLIGNGLAALLNEPDELARLRAAPALVAPAVEEFLRYDAPIQGVARLVLEPVRVADRTLRPGRVLILLIGSANRDEAVFDSPERLRIDRDPNRHLSFGGGIHYCIGAPLSRIEARSAFSRILARTGALEFAGEPVRQTETSFRAFARLPIAVRPS